MYKLPGSIKSENENIIRLLLVAIDNILFN